MSDEITVVLVDEHRRVRQSVRAFLETQPGIDIVGEASTGDEAVALCADLAPDVVLMDLVSSNELVSAVRKAARGEVTMHPRVAARMVQALQGGRQKSPLIAADLSKREMEVLKSLSEGLSNAAIAEALFISEKTVKSHVSNILSKLHLADRTQAAVFAWREGLMDADK